MIYDNGMPFRTAENVYYREELNSRIEKMISDLPPLDPEKTFPIKEAPEGIIKKTKQAW